MRFFKLKYTYEDLTGKIYNPDYPHTILARDLLEAKHTLKRILEKININAYNIRERK